MVDEQQQQEEGEEYYYYNRSNTTSTPQENVGGAAAAADSPLSGDETYELNAPSPKKRRGAQKKVITIRIGGEGDGSSISSTKSRGGEVYPPPDSWSWRKYGQKPIKGSPYPRGYYRCSSSKGCPARKQVERSRHDPNMLLITYSCEHNHSLPTTTKHNHHHRMSAATTSGATEIKSTTSTSTSSSNNINLPVPQSTHPEFVVPDFDSENIRFSEFARELGWFSNVESTFFESSTLMGPTWSEIDTAGMLNIGEEDESLFGDLGELPECSTVFRRVMVGETPCGAGS